MNKGLLLLLLVLVMPVKSFAFESYTSWNSDAVTSGCNDGSVEISEEYWDNFGCEGNYGSSSSLLDEDFRVSCLGLPNSTEVCGAAQNTAESGANWGAFDSSSLKASARENADHAHWGGFCNDSCGAQNSACYDAFNPLGWCARDGK